MTGISSSAPESRMPLVALIDANHPLTERGAKPDAGPASCTLNEIAAWPPVLPPAGSPTRMLIDEAARRAALTPLRIALESDSVPVRLAFLQQATTVAIMADMSGRMARPGSRLSAVTIDDDLMASGTLQLLANRDHQLSPAASVFERLLRNGIRRLEQVC